MDRDKLIGAHFDAYSDLVWVTNLEPKFKGAQLSAPEMEEYRQAWKGHTEARDWDWWLENVKTVPDAQLRREIAECHAEIDAFRKQKEPRHERLHRIMGGDDEKQPVQQATKDLGRER
ncbi:MAG: hypothetical protein C0501_25955 [Isosphaera sp.]|nr:hypothetical protein [Isosphaera sp.]